MEEQKQAVVLNIDYASTFRGFWMNLAMLVAEFGLIIAVFQHDHDSPLEMHPL